MLCPRLMIFDKVCSEKMVFFRNQSRREHILSREIHINQSILGLKSAKSVKKEVTALVRNTVAWVSLLAL